MIARAALILIEEVLVGRHQDRQRNRPLCFLSIWLRTVLLWLFWRCCWEDGWLWRSRTPLWVCLHVYLLLTWSFLGYNLKQMGGTACLCGRLLGKIYILRYTRTIMNLWSVIIIASKEVFYVRGNAVFISLLYLFLLGIIRICHVPEYSSSTPQAICINISKSWSKR